MSKLQILIVEDDQMIRQSLLETLEMEGYMVITANNGRDAFDKLEQGYLPSWILLDLKMPVMSGQEFLDVIKNNLKWKNIPVTLLSASGKIKDEAKIHNVDFIEKPIDLDVLLATAKFHCEVKMPKSTL